MTVANKNEEMVWRAWRIEMAGPTTFARAATHVGSVSVREGPIAHQSDASQGAAAKKVQAKHAWVKPRSGNRPTFSTATEASAPAVQPLLSRNFCSTSWFMNRITMAFDCAPACKPTDTEPTL